ncbi:MAG: right-handed parallel beta-helix repeat-containing protein [Sedimentisphaerales bacterium]|nr:right-handed parallel beta-helix repeat-containing protein [Sedimentisphaerales bacterium]
MRFKLAVFTTMIVLIAVSSLPVRAVSVIRVTADDVRISESCRIVIPPGTVIEDKNGNGVIQVVASDIEIDFAEGSLLRGSPKGRRPDEYAGYGICIQDQSNVAVRGARISGFWCGLWAAGADGLKLETVDASDNRRAYLKSTPIAEDGGDWLFPHNNDGNEWLKDYGAAIYVEDSNNVTIRRCKVHHGQNALCIDRVNDSKIYDNDFSFNSGWGIAMWRSSRNIITRNACDFCVRGYSHGVYNRGQDSAGILMFEQNNKNVIAENSATHGGDGFFGFAGREALGEAGSHPLEWYKRRGNTGNLLINNDFSYTPAHGIEMTFSFGNIFYGNRLVANAICGVWGGYSQDTLIAANHIEANGEMAYGLERGGINIEHGKANRILGNIFKGNKCGVHLWWDDDGDFASKPWAKANGAESTDNTIAGNTFSADVLAYHFRGDSRVNLGRDVFTGVEAKMQKEDAVIIKDVSDSAASPVREPKYEVLGRTHPVGARSGLYGRENIVMTSWGPWDHQSPLVRIVQDNGDSVRYSLHKMPPAAKVTVEGRNVSGQLSSSVNPAQPDEYTVTAAKPGIHPYLLRVEADDFKDQIRGTLNSVVWDVTFFKWTAETDPRKNIEQWRALADGPSAVTAKAKRLVFSYGWGGPSDQKIADNITTAKLGGDYFGMIAATRLPLSAGDWNFEMLSDDGIRLTADGKEIIDNWTWHGPTRNAGTLSLRTDKTVEVRVEHFEIDGYAVLELKISPEGP